MKNIVHIGLAAAVTLGLGLGSGQARAQSAPDAGPGHIAAPDVAKARSSSSHSRNHKPRHRVGAPSQGAAPSVAADKGPSGAASATTAPAQPSAAPAEGAAPSVAHDR